MIKIKRSCYTDDAHDCLNSIFSVISSEDMAGLQAKNTALKRQLHEVQKKYDALKAQLPNAIETQKVITENQRTILELTKRLDQAKSGAIKQVPRLSEADKERDPML